MIELCAVSKSYGGKIVLDQASMKVGTNEVTGLLGPSGSGKSTILKLLAGIIKPDTGTINLGSNRIGFVFQEHRLIPWKTAGENVSFSLQASGLNKTTALTHAKTFLQQVELDTCLNLYPAQLSGGMCQRVSIARALAIKPDILFLDEPFSSLDQDLKHNLLDFLRLMLQQHRDMTVLYVTHNPSELTDLAHSVYTLKTNGKLVKTSLSQATIKIKKEQNSQ